MKKFFPLAYLVLATSICLMLTFLMYNLVYPVKFKDEIYAIAAKNNLDPTLIASVINVESSFDPTAVSNKGAIGLMQVTPQTGQYVATMLGIEFEKNDLFDAKINIELGSYYLKYLMSEFDLNEALCAYNAGPTKVRSWLNDPNLSSDKAHLISIPFDETRQYLKKVKKNMAFYQNKF